MKSHPYSEVFPAMNGPDFSALVDDIRIHGLIQPIVLYEGQILDGRNRWRACEELGIEPKTTEYKGDDAIGYVVSLNLTRRHLNGSQRAVVANKIATLKHGEQKRLREVTDDAQICASSPQLAKTQKEAAEKMNVSRRAVQQARKVAEHATPELKRAVERGEVPVSVAAQLVDASPEAQNEAAKGGKKAAHKIAASMAKTKPIRKKPSKLTTPTLGPPCDGMQFARMAILDLEQIRPDDVERKQALATVRRWIDEHEEN